jgi:replicative superfamily II helicase
MMMQIDWGEMASLPSAQLREKLFSALQEAGHIIQKVGRDQPAVVELVPRLVNLLEQRPDLHDFMEPVSTLARAVGLWNYISPLESSFQEQVLAESMTQSKTLEYVTLHREQAQALKTILEGKNLVLSAPTSFGKSLLIDAAIDSRQFNRIAIIVPTLALLDELRRRLTRRFRDNFDIVIHHSERAKRHSVIFIGTQERLVNRDDLGEIDLVVVDEFYKLDTRRVDGRSNTLNAAAYQLLREAAQFVFLGPNVERILEAEKSRWDFEFQSTKFATVAVDTIDFSGEPDKFIALQREVYRQKNWPALIFVSSPERANELALHLMGSGRGIGAGRPMAEWLSRNFGPQWEIARAVADGIGVHHGRIPRSVAARFVQMFNNLSLPILICTSTLIEGVNTAAKSIFIFDDTINNRRHDFFTFSNIRGRAGRLGRHHVGKVYLFNPMPDEQDKEVGAPLFDDFEDAPDDFIVHLEGEDVTDSIRLRVETLADGLGLTVAELKRFSSLGVVDLAKKKEIR